MKQVIRKSQHGFTKAKLWLNHLFILYDEVTFSAHVVTKIDALQFRPMCGEQTDQKVNPFQMGNLSQMESQTSILGPTLFNIFITGLEDGIKWILMEFLNDSKWSEEGRPSWRNMWIGWKSGLARTLWSSTRASVRSCTYENIIQEWSKGWDLPCWGVFLSKGTGESWWTANLLWLNSVLLQKRNHVRFWVTWSRTSPAEIKVIILPYLFLSDHTGILCSGLVPTMQRCQ